MPSPRNLRAICLATSLALGLAGGCATTGKDTAEAQKKQDSSSILSSGPSPKVTGRQSADVQIALGKTLEAEGKFDEAKAAYESALKKDSKRADAEIRLAILEDRKANSKEADRHYAKAMKLSPGNVEILCDRGYSLYQRRSLTEAEETLKAALAIDPLHQRSHNNLGLVLARRGETEAALGEFTKAGCDASDAQSNLGLVLAMEGKFEESKSHYVQALKAKPSSIAAKQGIQATVVALAGQGDPTAIASRVQNTISPTSKADPSLMRTSGAN
jgi:Tfp pilus assembly protein PilF